MNAKNNEKIYSTTIAPKQMKCDLIFLQNKSGMLISTKFTYLQITHAMKILLG